MGLLSGLKKNFKSGSLFDSFAAAQATLAGDPGEGFRIMASGKERRRDNRREDEKIAMSRAERQAVYQWAKSNGYDEAEAQALANDPNSGSAIIQAQGKPVEFATTGGSRYDPRTGTWIRAPGRDADGNEYGISTDPAAAQPITRRGTKAVPLQPG